MIDLYTAATPNGHKVSIALEELGLPYHPDQVLDLGLEVSRRRPEFLAINPNGRIPALVDHAADDFRGLRVRRLPDVPGRKNRPAHAALTPKGRSRVVQWLMFQMGGIGPMMGQANVFYRYFPEKIQSVIDRYQGESRRLFRVLDTATQRQHEFLAGDYSIADIANWAWVRTHRWSGVDIDDLPHLQTLARPDSCPPGGAARHQYDHASSLRYARVDDPDNSPQQFVENARKMLETRPVHTHKVSHR
jgi:GST-like protein